jgi:diamine N-acetyltransferase
VSLKRLDWKNESAEYAIAMHPEGRGTGASLMGTHDLLELAFKELNLHRVYLCVRESNLRAKRFYEKAGFTYEGLARDAIRDGESFEGLEWWSILNGEL